MQSLRQLNCLRDAGLDTPNDLNRKGAEEIIREREAALYQQQQRAEDAPEIESYCRRMEELEPQIHELVPDWHPTHFDDAASHMCYVSTVENALDHALRYDLTELQSGLFYDGLHMDVDYYLAFTRDPNAEEMRGFQAALFRAYINAESESFDHLAILLRCLPMIRATSV